MRSWACCAISAPWSHVSDRRSCSGSVLIDDAMASRTALAPCPASAGPFLTGGVPCISMRGRCSAGAGRPGGGHRVVRRRHPCLLADVGRAAAGGGGGGAGDGRRGAARATGGGARRGRRWRSGWARWRPSRRPRSWAPSSVGWSGVCRRSPDTPGTSSPTTRGRGRSCPRSRSVCSRRSGSRWRAAAARGGARSRASAAWSWCRRRSASRSANWRTTTDSTPHVGLLRGWALVLPAAAVWWLAPPRPVHRPRHAGPAPRAAAGRLTGQRDWAKRPSLLERTAARVSVPPPGSNCGASSARSVTRRRSSHGRQARVPVPEWLMVSGQPIESR